MPQNARNGESAVALENRQNRVGSRLNQILARIASRISRDFRPKCANFSCRLVATPAGRRVFRQLRQS